MSLNNLFNYHQYFLIKATNYDKIIIKKGININAWDMVFFFSFLSLSLTCVASVRTTFKNSVFIIKSNVQNIM
jgi:hypothetical protein